MKDRIGEVAGYVYDYLEAEGESSVTAIIEAVDVPATKAYMAIGWLAHEGTVEFHDNGRGNTVSLE